jgi:hypothetical protein
VDLAAYRTATYTALAVYAMEDQDAPIHPATSSTVAPDVLVAALRPDVAPYGTVEQSTEVVDAVLKLLGDPELPENTRSALNAFLAWIDDQDELWLMFQREPPSIAGRGTANIETDPNAPR